MIDLTQPESRYARQELITWWDQERLSDASVLVVGAGALGNELAKCLALVGVGSLTVIDLDHIERSNLSRCVFFTDLDEGRPKAEVVAAGIARLNPELQVDHVVGDLTRQGLGWLNQFDLVLGGLDNREARVWINQACRKLGLPWIDGAIEGLRGVARTFLPEGPCYECTLSETDRQILSHRKSCALLDEEELAAGKVPTTATTASLVAAVQVQEAVRLLHGTAKLANEGWTFIGESLDSWVSSYSEDEYCLAHDSYRDIRLVSTSADTTLCALVEAVGPGEQVVAIDLESDLVLAATCTACGTARQVNRLLQGIGRSDVTCGSCDQLMALEAATSLDPDTASHRNALESTLLDLALPESDVVTLRTAERRIHLCLEGHTR